MKAVIRTGSKQYLVEPGQVLDVELVDGSAETLEFEPLLIIDGDKTLVGTPVVAGVKVLADVVEETKGPKVKVFKFKPKKRIKKLTGHRQSYSTIKITQIGSAKAETPKATAKKPAPRPKAAAK